MTVPALLDHVVIAGPDLGEVVAWFADRTGVTAAAGGAHPTGTANALVALTVGGARAPHYIELIGPDPARDIVPDTFGISGLDAPRVQTYAVHPDDIDAAVARSRAAGFDPGDVGDLSRRTPDGTLLEWRLTRGKDRRHDVPFLIDWGATPQPGLGELPSIEIVSFERTEPDPASTAEALAALGQPEGALAAVVAGEESAYRLTLRRADGTEVTLS